jgi:hypothetical protein
MRIRTTGQNIDIAMLFKEFLNCVFLKVQVRGLNKRFHRDRSGVVFVLFAPLTHKPLWIEILYSMRFLSATLLYSRSWMHVAYDAEH